MKFQKGKYLLVIHLKCALHRTRSKRIPLQFFCYDNEIAYRPTEFTRKEAMVLLGVGLWRNSLIGGTPSSTQLTLHTLDELHAPNPFTNQY
jgi:hypothetical protein